MKSKKILYCDLDGVLTDFEEGVRLKMGKEPEEINQGLMWSVLRKSHNFFEKLPWMPEGKLLWEKIKKYEPIILTGCPHGGWSEEQKCNWSKRELGENIKVITCASKDKSKYSKEGAILIDDRLIAKDKWEAMGGIFIHYEECNIERIIEELDIAMGSRE